MQQGKRVEDAGFDLHRCSYPPEDMHNNLFFERLQLKAILG